MGSSGTFDWIKIPVEKFRIGDETQEGALKIVKEFSGYSGFRRLIFLISLIFQVTDQRIEVFGIVDIQQYFGIDYFI